MSNKQRDAGSVIRRLSLAATLAIGALLPMARGAGTEASADFRAEPHRDGERLDRQIRRRPHRHKLHRCDGGRSGNRRRERADRQVAIDPWAQERYHPHHRLWRRQEAGRHVRCRGDLRHLDAVGGNHPPLLPCRHSRRHRKWQDPAYWKCSGCRHARPSSERGQAVRAGRDQFGECRCTPAGNAGSAFRRGFSPGEPRTGRAVERVRLIRRCCDRIAAAG